MLAAIFLFSLALSRFTLAQNAGTLVAETPPQIAWQTCTKNAGCTTKQAGLVLDADWRWLHDKASYTNCSTGYQWDATLCPDPVTCASNCALEGADYSGTYGITTSGNSVKLNLKNPNPSNVVHGSRIYLLDSSGTKYQKFSLLNKEFAFDVDVSQVPCGANAGLKFAEMDADGGMARFPLEKAGAKYGTGYCSASCDRSVHFINGEANLINWTLTSTGTGVGSHGSCCAEMNIWQANSISTVYTAHPCDITGQYRCTLSSGDCSSVCDSDGCDFNPYRLSQPNFYGQGKTVDTSRKFTVVTQFLTDDNTSTGNLVEIRRYYVQNGVVIPNTISSMPSVTTQYSSITDDFCAEQKAVFDDPDTFDSLGGLESLGAAMSPSRGGVLAISLLDDGAEENIWLDSYYPPGVDPSQPGAKRGTCPTSGATPGELEVIGQPISVTFSNIKYGDIGSTSIAVPVNSPPPTTTTTTTTTTSTTVPVPGPTQTKYGQCGGPNYTGPMDCAAGTTCVAVSPPYYSQCLPA